MTAPIVPADLAGRASARQPFLPIRGIGLPGALATNILNMIGIGPFITIPLALAAMGGPQAMLGWLLGALLCVCDGLVWAELGSALPRSGGPYHYLREAFGPRRLGSLFGFIFLWQSLLIGPLSIASGAVGFAQYASYLAPGLGHWSLTGIGAAICLVNTGLLWRDVRSIGKVSILVSVVVVAATVWIGLSGAFRFDPRVAFDFPHGAFALTPAFWTGLGASTLIAVYDYGGYNNVCLIGDEVRDPSRTIPVAVLVSIAVVAALYLGLNLAILGTVPWRVAQHSNAIVADFMQRIYGPGGGIAVTVLILIASWGSALTVLLGYSRVPYAAAAAGQFFRPFARLHSRGGFPVWGLAYMGLLSALACFFSLGDLIALLILVQMMFQFLAQCAAVVLLRRRAAREPGRFRMPLYPLPVLITAVGWIYIVSTSQTRHLGLAAAMLLAGVVLYLVQAARRAEWPFRPA